MVARRGHRSELAEASRTPKWARDLAATFRTQSREAILAAIRALRWLIQVLERELRDRESAAPNPTA